MRRLASRLPGVVVASTATRGIAPDHVEAATFAWLAHRYLAGLPGNVTTVTGARGPRVLGALYRGAVTDLQHP
jgi:anhydro-N-acetylmuramic acid kinase